MDNKEEILAAAKTALVDYEYASNAALRPRFVSNDSSRGRKVSAILEDELAKCASFEMSVAFITLGGIAPLLMRLKELENKGVKGKILTTDYLTFSEPDALRKLASFPNIEVRMYPTGEGRKGFHTKGYFFNYENDVHKALVGSSNLTSLALSENKEWNVIFSSAQRGELWRELRGEFEELWDSAKPLDSILHTYERMYEQKKEILRNQPVISIESARLEPNSMQAAFINEFETAVLRGDRRGLLISATGTGKTYASAFAVRDLDPKRVLFLVHREQVLRSAMESYDRVFAGSKSLGLYSGSSHESHADIVFATVQTMSRENHLKNFDPTAFDFIIIDEVHRAGADSYQKIINYFDTEYFFGMTATPDRSDGFDIYELFDHNILYEIRLQQALEESLLCPFHYFGITDLAVHGELPNDDTELRDFSLLTSDERVKHILDQTQYYGFSGSRVKGLMFCTTKREAKALSEKFNARGLKTLALTGEDSQEERSVAVQRLVMDQSEKGFEDQHLDYILTVDIFNEGVDIPEINQVVMLRPTESAIVFVQQLGRGLRKTREKEFVVVLDFIGNYKNNFLIPIALSGDRTYNKDTVRKYVLEGSRVLPGASSIHFDAVAKEQIFKSIDSSQTGASFLKQKYFALKHKMGRIPTMCDFEQLGEIDPSLFIDNQKSYYRFLARYEDEAPKFSEEEQLALEYISRFLVDGIRLEELIILRKLAVSHATNFQEVGEEIASYCAPVLDESSFNSAVTVLEKGFYPQGLMQAYKDVVLLDISENDPRQITIAAELEKLLRGEPFRLAFADVVEYGILRYETVYASPNGKLKHYAKYTRTQACRALGWDADEGSTIFGYKIKHNTCPIFVTYQKDDDIADSTKYEDQFVNESVFSWMTRSRRTLSSPEVEKIINAKADGTEIHLFVKKSDDEGTDFYYMGEACVQDYRQTTISTENGDLPIVNFQLLLDQPVRDDLYAYFVD